MKYMSNKDINSKAQYRDMSRVKILVDGFKCERCGHEWAPRTKEQPRVCPKCHSPYWDKPRKEIKKNKV